MANMQESHSVSWGTCYGVGVGPGNPELLTLKAARVIGACQVVAAPQTRGGATLALDIAAQAVDLEGKDIIRLPFAMSRDAGERRRMHEESVGLIAEQLARGKDVAVLTLGDPGVFSSFFYLADGLRERGFAIEVIPGVTSFSAVAARLGQGLTEMDEPPACGTFRRMCRSYRRGARLARDESPHEAVRQGRRDCRGARALRRTVPRLACRRLWAAQRARLPGPRLLRPGRTSQLLHDACGEVTVCGRMEERLASYRLRNTTFFSLFCLANVVFFNPLLAKCRQAFDFAVSISARHKKGGHLHRWTSPRRCQAVRAGTRLDPYAIPSQVLMTGIQPPTHTMTMSMGST